MATTVYPDWDPIQYNDPEDNKTSLRKLYKIKDPKQILEKLDKIATNLPAETDDEKSGKALIEKILNHIKSLCFDPEGSNFSAPLPKQHIYRKEVGDKKPKPLNVINDDAAWRFNGFPISYKEIEARKKFFWSHVDLLGLFFTKLGPAPLGADKYNFFLPLTAVFARWSRYLIKKSLGPTNMFQCTWAEHEPGSGKRTEFSLGASLGGFHSKSLGDNLRRTRFAMLSEFRNVTEVSIKDWNTGNPLPWEFDNSQEKLWKFGNCAETYPLFQLLSELDDQTKTYGVALRKAATDDVVKQDETISLAYYEDKMLDRIEKKDAEGKPTGDYEHRYLAPPCGNCTHLVDVIAQVDLSLFTPIDQFRDPVDFQVPSDEPPDN
ncbi:hypothetical protein F4781DRAFT_435560 [Annulohypoxylon bovei var. microspora]|nr:hypothetical protein F4781DRAFT_435560 [Annulohypoxylon bovei var. microspora]